MALIDTGDTLRDGGHSSWKGMYRSASHKQSMSGSLSKFVPCQEQSVLVLEDLQPLYSLRIDNCMARWIGTPVTDTHFFP